MTLIVQDLWNPKRKSGFDYVNSAANATQTRQHKMYWRAAVGAPGALRKSSSIRHLWRGPVRKTPEQAAQDYCDYINSGKAPAPKPSKAPVLKPTPLMLKSAGHKRPQVTSVQVARRPRQKPVGNYILTPGYVYLVGEAGNESEVKIGWSARSGFSRLAELQTGNPRLLLGLGEKPGTQKDEYELHVRYEPDNVLQEWFEVSPELLQEFDLDERQFEIAVYSHGRRTNVV